MDTAAVTAEKLPQYGGAVKKKRGAMHLIRATLFMLKGKNRRSKSLADGTAWTRLFGTVRPLRLPDNHQSPPPLPSIPEPVEVQENPGQPILQEGSTAMHQGSSSSSSSSSSSTAGGGMSGFASAQNLQELDNGDDDDYDENDTDAYYDGIEGDEMIDAKAEEFIAYFYQQMRLQQSGINHHY